MNSFLKDLVKRFERSFKNKKGDAWAKKFLRRFSKNNFCNLIWKEKISATYGFISNHPCKITGTLPI
jgi:hypothetical protein